MDIGFIVCSYLTADFLNKDKVLHTIKSYSDKYSKLNTFGSNNQAQQNSIQLLFNVQDFTNPGFILNIFSNKVDIVYNPNKDASALDKDDFEKALSVLDGFFYKLNLKPQRLSFMSIAKEEVSEKEAQNIISKVSKIAKKPVIEFYYKDVVKVDNNNIVTVLQVNDIPQTNTNNQNTQNQKDFIISIESNNIPKPEIELNQDTINSLKEQLISALIENLNKNLSSLNKKIN
jgi:hypothetical protein